MANGTVRFSYAHLDLIKYADHYRDVEQSIRYYFGAAQVLTNGRFIGLRPSEISNQRDARLQEIDTAGSMTVLAAVEAAFRIDYIQRCYQQQTDPISVAFQALYQAKATRASLIDDIFATWKTHTTGAAHILGDLKGAFRFRDWIAHGRYWQPTLGQPYDYQTVYGLAV